MKQYRNTLALICMLGVLGAGQAIAGSISVTPTDDRTIGDTNNDGIGDSLLSQTDGYLRTGFFGTHWRSALEFDISGIGAGSIVDSANLFLRDQGSSQTGTLNVWGYAGDGAITLGDASMTGTLVGTVEIVNGAGAQNFNLDVTSFLQTLVDANATYAGFLLGAATPTGFGGGASDMCSGDVPNFCGSANFPTLSVAFSDAPAMEVAEPAALALLGACLAGLGLYRRRRTA